MRTIIVPIENQSLSASFRSSTDLYSELMRGTVYEEKSSGLSRGSEWRKWVPHVHGPTTILSNQYERLPDGNFDWLGFISKLEALAVRDAQLFMSCGARQY